MTVLQVAEPMFGGHHTNYLLALLPAVGQLKLAGLLDEAVFSVSPEHHARLQSAGVIAASSDVVHWDPSLCDTDPAPDMAARFRLYRAIRGAVDRVRPDALLSTSADYDIVPNAVASTLRRTGFRPGKTAAVLHYGYPAASSNAKETLKRLVYETAWKASRWDKLLLVNPLVYEGLTAEDRSSSFRGVELLPDPVPQPERPDVRSARERLGIPVDGRYIGFVGMMDHRKAIPELLRAFAACRDALSNTRLLLAGQLCTEYRRLIDAEYQPLIDAARIIVIDRHLTTDEIADGYAAVDLHAILQYRRINLSANVLKAVAFRKPVLVDSHGHAGMIAERFGAGHVCRVDDGDSIARALVQAMDTAAAGRDDAIERLIRFHSLDNFAGVALSAVIGPEVFGVLGPSASWEWVCRGLRPARRAQPSYTLPTRSGPATRPQSLPLT